MSPGAGDSKETCMNQPPVFPPGQRWEEQGHEGHSRHMLGVRLRPEEQGTLLSGLPGEGEHMSPSCIFLLFYLHLLPRQQETSQETLFSAAICVSATRIFFSAIGDNWGCHTALWAKFCSISQTRARLVPATTSKAVQAVLGIKSFFFVLLFRSLHFVAKQLHRES